MIYVGIDPGASGGIAWVHNGSAGAISMPETDADVAFAINDVAKRDLAFAVVEAVHSMPKQGVASSFKFGVNFGLIRGILAMRCTPREFVTPSKWQKAMGCLTHGDKNVSKRRAQELFPHLRVTHAMADALLLAEYCRITRAVTLKEATTT